MVEIAQIVDRKSLEAWFDQLSQEPGVLAERVDQFAFWIAQRCVLRTLPFMVKFGIEHGTDSYVLHVFRAFMSSGIPGKFVSIETETAHLDYPTLGKRVQIDLQLLKATDSCGRAYLRAKQSGYPETTDNAEFSTSNHTNKTRRTARKTARLIVSQESKVRTVKRISIEVRSFSSNAIGYFCALAKSSWEIIREDCNLYTSFMNSYPLWIERENPYNEDWSIVCQKLLNEADPHEMAIYKRGESAVDWSFWVDWYNAILIGAPLDMALQREIISIEPMVWKGDIASLIDKIDRIRDKCLQDQTYIGEHINVGMSSNLITFVSDVDVPTHLLKISVERLQNAVLNLRTGQNQIGGFSFLLGKLETLESRLGADTLSQLNLYYDCQNFIRTAQSRIKSGSIIDEVEILDDALVEIARSAAHLKAHSPVIRQAIQNVDKFEIEKITPLVIDQLEAGIDGILNNWQIPYLLKGSDADLEVLKDEDLSDEEKKLSGVKLIGRIYRICKELIDMSNKGVKFAENIPFIRALITLLLRLLK